MRQLLIDHSAPGTPPNAVAGAVQSNSMKRCGFRKRDPRRTHRDDEALTRLAASISARAKCSSSITGGLTIEETAVALGVSLATVKRELPSARARPAAELEHTGDSAV